MNALEIAEERYLAAQKAVEAACNAVGSQAMFCQAGFFDSVAAMRGVRALDGDLKLVAKGVSALELQEQRLESWRHALDDTLRAAEEYLSAARQVLRAYGATYCAAPGCPRLVLDGLCVYHAELELDTVEREALDREADDAAAREGVA